MEPDQAPETKTTGGESVPVLPYAKQWIDDSDIDAVVQVLKSDFVTQGPAVEKFEAALAAQTGAAHAVAVSSGTAALHLACLGLGMEPGKTGITSPITFAASANCFLYCGGNVAFADVDPRTGLLSPASLENELTLRARRGEEPGVVVAVSLAGKPADLPALKALCDRFGWKLLEDSAHSLGAVYPSDGAKTPSASCRHSHAAILSFHPVKHICTGEGGAVLTNDGELADTIRLLRSHGIVRSSGDELPPWHYEQIDLGFHYRLTDIQAALGLSQLGKLPGFLRRRRELARRYTEQFSAPPFQKILSAPEPDDDHAWHLYVLHFCDSAMRHQAFEALASVMIRTQVHYIPVYRHPFYRSILGEMSLPGAEAFHAGCLSLPMFPKMTDADQDRVVEVLASLVESYD